MLDKMSKLLQYPNWAALHAWLLVGTDNQSKEQWVRTQAKLFFCAKNGCNSCQACLAVDNNAHPDFLIINPEKWNVAAVADLKQIVNYQPLAKGRIIYLPAADHLLVAQATGLANRLLKTLEEPTTQTWFFLSVKSQSTLLATIRNRCGAMHFKDQLLALARPDLVTMLNNPLSDPEVITENLVQAFDNKEIDLQWLWQVAPVNPIVQAQLRMLPLRLNNNSDLYLQLRVLVPKLQNTLAHQAI